MHFNKNHDKLGRFTFGDGNGDGVSPNSFRTPDLDKEYANLEKSGLIKATTASIKSLDENDDPNEKWGKDITNAAKIGIAAAMNIGYEHAFDPEEQTLNDMLNTFVLNDHFEQNAYFEVAYLASKGWTKDQIVKAFKSADDMWSKNMEYEDAVVDYRKNKLKEKVVDTTEVWVNMPYTGIYTMADRAYEIDDDEPGFLGDYADSCITYAKAKIIDPDGMHLVIEHSDSSDDYLEHFNPNHDPKNGQFTYSKEGYKSLKKEYKSDIREARKGFNKTLRESKKNRLFQKRETRDAATALVDKYAQEKSEELFAKYVNLKAYKAAMKGKELNPKSIFAQNYFSELGLDPNILGIPYPTLNDYIVGVKNGKTQVTKDSKRLYYIPIYT